MTEVITTIVNSLPAVIVSVTGFVALFVTQSTNKEKIKESVKEMRHDISNNHDTHLREDLDDKHSEIVTRLDGMDSSIRETVKRDTTILNRIDRLEDNGRNEHMRIWQAIHNIERKM